MYGYIRYTFLVKSGTQQPSLNSTQKNSYGYFMAKTARYLDESKDGWYSYRRRVPAKLQDIFKQREFKYAYRTKSLTKALRLHADYHEEIEQQICSAKAFLKTLPLPAQEPAYKTPRKEFLDIYANLHKKRMLPHQLPTLNSAMTEEEQMAWSFDNAKYAEASILFDADQITAEEFQSVINGLTYMPFKEFVAAREYIRYLENEEIFKTLPDRGQTTLKILKGDYTSPDPNIEDLFNHYIDFSRKKVANKERNPKQQHKLEQDIGRLASVVYQAHMNGKETPIDDLEITAIESAFATEYPRISTRKRNYTQLSAAVNLWNRRNKKQKVDNPFEELKDDLPKHDPLELPRRVWHPDEFKFFWQSIQNELDLSKKLLGMLMAYAGKPASETAGLIRDDLVVNHEIPHIKFRDNQYRVIGKKRQENTLPLVGVILEEFKRYLTTFDGGRDDLLFPNLYTKSSGELSKILNKHKRELHPVKNTKFQNYGLRHTFKPRYEEARISSVNGMYLFGHKTASTSATHDKYAKGLFASDEFKSLRDDMEAVMRVSTWTYSYEVSDFSPI